MKTIIRIHPVDDLTDVRHYKNLKKLCKDYENFSYSYLQKISWQQDISKGLNYKGHLIQKVEIL